ncbi:sigma-70 family RNA polymerase sigma factor [Leptobacterium flavescens]|uniref:Sigma-70 family RNA polymerase sigma factor n=1 Tax=Leptobacterium flavescens TaxID=472055 RepID=A0A6P0UIC6_9FLAO|nr:RNA polymerase sigma factor [Leptobacterium flavescens]NER13004.1 sigma-70 family RNA polymerase sigma factor [Leptobacterium flavescens]
MNLEDLIKKCRNNDRKAQERLYLLYKDALFILCLKYCRNIEEAEDNLQDAFLIILKNIKKYKGKGSFEGWLKRITINRAIDRYKKQPHNQVLDERFPETEDTMIEEGEMNLSMNKLLELIQGLPDRYRLVFSLYELDNYQHSEIARMLSISEGTSKSNLHRAKILLKKQIKEQESDLKKKSMQS